MSNNEDMEIDFDRGRGLRGTTDKSDKQKARGNKSDHRGLEERERESNDSGSISENYNRQHPATMPMKGHGFQLESVANGHEERKNKPVHIKQVETKTYKTVVRRARESNISTIKHENCNRQRVAMTTKESGPMAEGPTTMVCQATKLKQV
jgi:hypothetical protein